MGRVLLTVLDNILTPKMYFLSLMIRLSAFVQPFRWNIIFVSLILLSAKVSPSNSSFEIIRSSNTLRLLGMPFCVSSTCTEIFVVFVSSSSSTFSGMNQICTVTPAVFSPECFLSLMLSLVVVVTLHWLLYNNA